MAAPLIAVVVLFGGRNVPDTAAMQHDIPLRRRWGEAGVTLGLIVIIFGGFRSGFAVATETSAFAALYASSAAAWCSASSRLRHGPGIYARRQAIGPGIVHRRGGAGHGVRADVQ